MSAGKEHPYLPTTDIQRAEALEAAGLTEEYLVQSILPDLRLQKPLDIPRALSEPELTRHARLCAGRNSTTAEAASFLGAGCYDHFIPAAVDAVAARGEFLTAYTPYQAEAGQGTLSAIFEYQTMIASLTGADVSNAGVYDGATAVAEAVLMAKRLHRKSSKVVVSASLHPEYIETLRTYVQFTDIEIITTRLENGVTNVADIAANAAGAFAVVAANPGFLGSIEPLRDIFDVARAQGALSIAVVNPFTLGVLEAPALLGADIVCGDGQPLGCYQYYGGPAFGFMATRMEYIRQLPGRVAGETRDASGRRGFTLTFQTREQHIRRERATSNICTNHALMSLRATVYLSLLGPRGLREAGEASTALAHYAARKIAAVDGYSLVYDAPFFNEFAVTCPRRAADVVRDVRGDGILAGVPLERFFPGREKDLLVAVTEKRTVDEIDALAAALERAGGRT